MAAYAPVIRLSELDGEDGFRLDGVTADDESGGSVSSAGDVNGDGYADLIVGARYADPNGTSSGSSYVVFGKATGWVPTFSLAALDGLNGFRLDGRIDEDQSGAAVSSAGDVNGDGFGDLLVGAPESDPIGRTTAGTSYVVFGKASGFASVQNLFDLDGTTGLRVQGASADDKSGHAVSAAGDVNGDGLGDFIIGALNADPLGVSIGAAYVVYGTEAGFNATLDLATLDGTNGFRISGGDESDQLGSAVASAGDVNGDGLDDVLVSAPLADPGDRSTAGVTYLIYGKASGQAAVVNPAALKIGEGLIIEGAAGSDLSGVSVASAGDINADGYADIVIGASRAFSVGVGSAYVVYGQPAGLNPYINLAELDGDKGFKLTIEDEFASTGFSVSSAGDFNGDGFDDLIVGSPGADPGFRAQAGVSYIVFGKAERFAAEFDLAQLDGNNGLRIEGALAGDSAGSSVAGAGDVNGDGFDDVIIGADDADPGGVVSAGSSYVIFGHAPLTSVTRIGTALGQTIFGGIGDDRLEGLDGNDTLTAGEGDDALFGGTGVDLVQGQDGDDVLQGGSGNDRLEGGNGYDALYGGSGVDFMEGGLDDDFMDGGSGLDTATYFYITAGAVTVDLALTGEQDTGSAGLDTLVRIENLNGTDGFGDTLRGGAGANVINGYGGNDDIRAVGGNDTLLGWFGDDVLEGGAGNDTVTGGSGTDTATYFNATAKVTVSLAIVGAQNTLGAGTDTLSTVENLNGTNLYGDTLTGNASANVINGYGGDDRIQGGDGKDTLIGGTGVDTFVYTALTDSDGADLDTITGFVNGTDRLDLGAIDANSTIANDQAFTQVAGAFTAAGQLRFVQDGGTTRVELNTDADFDAEAVILITGTITSTAGWVM